ncbi:MAG TPA: alanine--tRNA ligase [Rhodobacteraceae bacterium]|nr:alanine--tRNA ligase [Paracoccaceae bacterium]
MTPDEIRNSFLSEMTRQGSIAIPSASVVPENDPSTLFVGSGMQPMVPYLLGLDHPMGQDLVNVQPCIRTGDIEEVGDLTHLTFFEMIGRWELGADPKTYKAEQIRRVMDWQVNVLGLDPKRLSVTIHSGNSDLGINYDDASLKVWQEFFASHNIEAPVEEEPFTYGASRGGRIFVYDDSENWWSRAGVPSNMPVGEPGGPDSEMFFDHDPEGDPMAHPADGGARFVEIGNNVFMSHKRTENGFVLFERPNIDYGGGLERILSAANGEVDVYKSPFFAGPMQYLEKQSNKEYSKNEKAFRIILDHTRATVFLLASGVYPSNKDAGYVVRRLIRRAARVGKTLGYEGALLSNLAQVFINESETYTFVQDAREQILNALEQEETLFLKTLRNGEREIRRFMKTGDITGKIAFQFYETYGFPLELTKELLEEEGMDIQGPEGFDLAAKEHSIASKSASTAKFSGGLGDKSETTVSFHTATHLLLAGLREVLGDHVHQRGSNITPERIRFDVSHPQKITAEELQQVVTFVNTAIKAGAEVKSYEMDKAEARKAGIEGSFWEKYPERVTIYEMKDSKGTVFSRELCGGPHVNNTGNLTQLGSFKVLKEESSSAGVRRIKAVIS